MAALVLPLIEGRQRAWPIWTIASFVASAALFVAVGAHVRRLTRLGGSPIVALSVLTNCRLMTGIGTVTIFYSSVASFYLILSIYLQQGRGLGAFSSGAIYSIMIAGFLLTTFTGDRLIAILGPHSLTVGAAVVAAGHLGMRFAVVRAGIDGPLRWLFGRAETKPGQHHRRHSCQPPLPLNDQPRRCRPPPPPEGDVGHATEARPGDPIRAIGASPRPSTVGSPNLTAINQRVGFVR